MSEVISTVDWVLSIVTSCDIYVNGLPATLRLTTGRPRTRELLGISTRLKMTARGGCGEVLQYSQPGHLSR